MRFTRPLTIAALVAGALLGTTGSASAHTVDVTTGTNGSCPTGYGEIAQIEYTTVCVHLSIPDVQVKTGPCPTGYLEYSVLNGQYGLCIRWGHA